MIIPKDYENKVKFRSAFKYYIGLVGRFLLNIKYSFFRWMARYNGAIIGDGTILTWKLAQKANSNLVIGDDCAIETANLDLRSGGGE